MNPRKGFVVSFDALLALFVVFSFLVVSFALLSKTDESFFSILSTRKFSFDVLTVLEHSGKFQDAVLTEDSSDLDSFLNLMPYNYCARLEIFEQDTSQPLMTASRTNCRNVPATAFLARSFFFINFDNSPVFYTAELRTWQSG